MHLFKAMFQRCPVFIQVMLERKFEKSYQSLQKTNVVSVLWM